MADVLQVVLALIRSRAYLTANYERIGCSRDGATGSHFLVREEQQLTLLSEQTVLIHCLRHLTPACCGQKKGN